MRLPVGAIHMTTRTSVGSKSSCAENLLETYAGLIPFIGRHQAADEVVPAGATVRESRRSIPSHGLITGSREQIRRTLESIFTPHILGPKGGGVATDGVARIISASPDVVILAPHAAADGWFLLSRLREAGFDGPGVMTRGVDRDDELVGFRRYSEMIEGFYVPISEKSFSLNSGSRQGSGTCDENSRCGAAHSGVHLMAEAVRVCHGGDDGCLRDFVGRGLERGGRTFGVLDAAQEAARGAITGSGRPGMAGSCRSEHSSRWQARLGECGGHLSGSCSSAASTGELGNVSGIAVVQD